MDLNKTAMDIDKENKKVSIVFNKDAVRVSNPEIGPEDIKIITVSDPNIFHKINDKDRNNAQKHAIKMLRDEATKKGIKHQTMSEAKIVITGFLSALGYQSKIIFK